MRSDVEAHVCEHGDEEWIIGWSEHLAGVDLEPLQEGLCCACDSSDWSVWEITWFLLPCSPCGSNSISGLTVHTTCLVWVQVHKGFPQPTVSGLWELRRLF